MVAIVAGAGARERLLEGQLNWRGVKSNGKNRWDSGIERAAKDGSMGGGGAAVPSGIPACCKSTKAAAKVDGEFIVANAAQTQEWPSYGLDYAETRFSRLQQINDGNVKDLGLVWR